jgi:dTDP-4-amino-4,6-dideoxygalactose transaminase
MSFEVIRVFEEALADFFGSPYAVTTDCCTHAVELCLRHTDAQSISVPKHTYISIPLLSRKLGIDLQWRDEEWLDYYHVTDTVVDAAVLWKPNSYIPGTLMCVSFQFKKHLSLGRGGVILTDNKEAALALKKMSYDGRTPDTPWATQNITTMGYHYYMTPETATLGLEKLPAAIETAPKQWTIEDWPDLTEMGIFK